MSEHIHPLASAIEQILQREGCWYEHFIHEPVRTSVEAALVRPEYGQHQGAKSLIVKGKRPHEEKQFFMVVVSGDRQFDKHKLRDMTGFTDVRFASAEEVDTITSGVIPGGVPPWGNLFHIPVFADEQIFANEKIIFNAGDRRVSIAMLSSDYKRIVAPTVVAIT